MVVALSRHLIYTGIVACIVVQHCGYVDAWTNPCRARLKRDGTRTETRFGLSEKWTSLFKSAGESVQSTAGSRGVHISGQTMDRPCSKVRCTISGYPLQLPISPSHPLGHMSPCSITFRTASNSRGTAFQVPPGFACSYGTTQQHTRICSYVETALSNVKFDFNIYNFYNYLLHCCSSLFCSIAKLSKITYTTAYFSSLPNFSHKN